MPPRVAHRSKHRPPPQGGLLNRLIDPIDRLSETIFSVLILLTFTLAYRIIRLGPSLYEPIPPDYMVNLFVAALGATLAWGMIDGVIYVLLSFLERGETHRFLARVQAATTQEEGLHAIADELDYTLEPITGGEQRRLLYLDVLEHLRDSKPKPVRLTRDDVLGGLASMLVAVLAVLPSLIPLLLLRNHYWLALRVSNLISFAVLFYTGYQWGKYSGSNPWKLGLLLFLLGVTLALIAIPLGG